MRMTVHRVQRTKQVRFILRLRATSESGTDLQLVAEATLDSAVADQFDKSSVYEARLIEPGAA